MGKAALFLVVAAMITGGVLLRQVDQTEIETDRRQAARQGQVLAREIARSGQNVLLAKARRLQRENPGVAFEEIVSMVNGANGSVTGTYQGGDYDASIYLTSSSSFAVKSTGTYKINDHQVETERDGGITVEILGEDILGEEILEVDEPSELDVTFLESMAGYCSGIYLQRWVPNTSGGTTNYTAQEPELIFAPGNNRDGASAHYSTTLDPGDRLNFILAVDADFNCEQRNNNVPWNHSTYEYTRNALVESVGELSELQEDDYAMIQEKPGTTGTWRVAFEDLYFSSNKLEDIKQNSYGGSWNSSLMTYGGSGWNQTDSNGYWKLRDFGNKPDFSDQVIEVTLVAVTPPPAS